MINTKLIELINLQIIIRDPNMRDDFSNVTITIEEAKSICQGKEWHILVHLSNSHIPIPKIFPFHKLPSILSHSQN